MKLENKKVMNIKDEANKYAERICNGEFPIEYTREQVVNHTAGDFIAGAEAYQNHVLKVLKENYEACKTLTPEDAARSAQDIVNETYEDMIFILGKEVMTAGEKWKKIVTGK